MCPPLLSGTRTDGDASKCGARRLKAVEDAKTTRRRWRETKYDAPRMTWPQIPRSLFANQGRVLPGALSWAKAMCSALLSRIEADGDGSSLRTALQ